MCASGNERGRDEKCGVHRRMRMKRGGDGERGEWMVRGHVGRYRQKKTSSPLDSRGLREDIAVGVIFISSKPRAE